MMTNEASPVRASSSPGWRTEAACHSADPRAFFPPDGVNATAAKAICATCPVTDECLESTLAWEDSMGVIPYGVFGGLSARQRELVLRRRRSQLQAV